MKTKYIVESDGRKRLAVLTSCQHCNREFWSRKRFFDKGKGRYCSRECSALSERQRTILECTYCGNAFERSASKIKKSKSGLQFCSRQCKDMAQRIGGIKEIQPNHYGKHSPKCDYRVLALRHKEHRCEKCGYDKVINVLEVHHKDRNKKNNKLENLEIMCPTCHAEIHFETGTGRYTTYRTGI